MIKHIIFSNLYSFEGEHQISFQDGINIIYGKNSAGKSNILNAIEIWKSTFTGHFDYRLVKNVVNKQSKSDTISLGLMYEINGEEWVYDFVYNVIERRFISETLYHNRKIVIDIEGGKIMTSTISKAVQNALAGYNISGKGFNVFMSELNSECEVVDSILKQHNFFDINLDNEVIIEKVYGDKDIKSIIRDEISSIDIAVKDFKIIDKRDFIKGFAQDLKERGEDIEMIERFVSSLNPFDIRFVHNNFTLSLKNESNGTNQYFNLITKQLVMNKYANNIVFLNDELGNHLSDELLLKYVNFFSQNINGQLIATTHNLILLEKKIVDKANIIFIDKVKDVSTISRLSDYKGVRSDSRQNWRKMYESGRFGAIANV